MLTLSASEKVLPKTLFSSKFWSSNLFSSSLNFSTNGLRSPYVVVAEPYLVKYSSRTSTRSDGDGTSRENGLCSLDKMVTFASEAFRRQLLSIPEFGSR